MGRYGEGSDISISDLIGESGSNPLDFVGSSSDGGRTYSDVLRRTLYIDGLRGRGDCESLELDIGRSSTTSADCLRVAAVGSWMLFRSEGVRAGTSAPRRLNDVLAPAQYDISLSGVPQRTEIPKSRTRRGAHPREKRSQRLAGWPA